MLFSQAKSRPIMSTSTASRVGKLAGFVVDASRQRVVALRVRKSDTGDTLHWEQVQGFGPDAVMVTGADVLTAPRDDVAQLVHDKVDLLGKRVLDDSGDARGKVEDVDFDPGTGRIVRLLTSQGDVAGEHIVASGSYAVIVRAQRDEPPAPAPPPSATRHTTAPLLPSHTTAPSPGTPIAPGGHAAPGRHAAPGAPPAPTTPVS